jgi:putative dehydrogenase
MTTIAVIAMGEMGASVARRLVDKGAEVLTSLAGRSPASAERARLAGAVSTDDRTLIAESDMLLSIVPPSSAAATAARFLPLIEQAGRKPVYIDCNATAPQTLLAMSGDFAKRGLRFIDGTIIGPAPKPDGSSPRLYMSGTIADEAEILQRLGLDVRVLSSDLGDASALKMSYAGMTKGFQALASSMVLAARRSGATSALVSEMMTSQPQLYGWLKKQLPVMYDKAYRWDGEMHEVAKFLLPQQAASDMLSGAAEVFQLIAADQSTGAESEIIATLNGFVAPRK